MPQEIALYGEFSIRETFIYFGWCAGMTTEEVDEKLIFLLKVKNFHGSWKVGISKGVSKELKLPVLFKYLSKYLVFFLSKFKEKKISSSQMYRGTVLFSDFIYLYNSLHSLITVFTTTVRKSFC